MREVSVVNICIVGTGYVGLTAGACFADMGHYVTCVDTGKLRIEKLKHGTTPVYEIGLDDLIERNTRKTFLRFSTNLSEPLINAHLVVLTSSTPESNGYIDLTDIKNKAKDVATALNGYKVIAIKSTVPAGETKTLHQIIKDRCPSGSEYDLVLNPGLLRKGSAVYDFMHPDRIVIGAESEKAVAIMTELYKPINAPVLVTDFISAELISNVITSRRRDQDHSLPHQDDLITEQDVVYSDK